MDIIQRNFFNLLSSGSLNAFKPIEPMSAFKWARLLEIAKVQGVADIALRGIRNAQHESTCNVPVELIDNVSGWINDNAQPKEAPSILLNPLFKQRLQRIRQGERHAIDCSVETLQLLDIMVANVYGMINVGLQLKLVLTLGSYLRTKGDKVDFVKFDLWIASLHIRKMAALTGSILIEIFGFDADECPFVLTVDKKAKNMVLHALQNNEKDDADKWHLQQSRAGFITNNSGVIGRNMKRSLKYFSYAPLEAISSLVHNIAKSVSEIEE